MPIKRGKGISVIKLNRSQIKEYREGKKIEEIEKIEVKKNNKK